MELDSTNHVLHFVFSKVYFKVRDFCFVFFFEVSLPALHELLRPNRSLILEKDFDVRDSVGRDCCIYIYFIVM